MDSDSLFGDRLKKERKRLGLGQGEAAAIAGISREMWGKYERGLGMPGGDVLAAIAREGVDVNYLLTNERVGLPGPSMSKRARALAKAYDSLGDDGRKAVESVVAIALTGQATGALVGGQVFHGSVGQVVHDTGAVGKYTVNIDQSSTKKD